MMIATRAVEAFLQIRLQLMPMDGAGPEDKSAIGPFAALIPLQLDLV
jgi:hypothetical protein